jgi:hypothetical protein
MENDKLKNKIELFLEGYENLSDVRIKASDYLKGIDMMLKLNLESSREKMMNNSKIVINFNINEETEVNYGDND